MKERHGYLLPRFELARQLSLPRGCAYNKFSGWISMCLVGDLPPINNGLYLLQAPLLLCSIFLSILIQRILEAWERRLGPVEGRDIQLVNCFGSSSRQAAKSTPMESIGEAQDGKVWRARFGVIEAGRNFLGAPVNAFTSPFAAIQHKGGLEGKLVCLRTGLCGENFVKPRWCGPEKTVFQHIMPFA